MLGPLPCSNRKNREKPSFGTAEQDFQSHEFSALPTKWELSATFLLQKRLSVLFARTGT
jgi:hypothetical protein